MLDMSKFAWRSFRKNLVRQKKPHRSSAPDTLLETCTLKYTHIGKRCQIWPSFLAKLCPFPTLVIILLTFLNKFDDIMTKAGEIMSHPVYHYPWGFSTGRALSHSEYRWSGTSSTRQIVHSVRFIYYVRIFRFEHIECDVRECICALDPKYGFEKRQLPKIFDMFTKFL